MHVYIQFSQINLLKGQLSLLQLAVLLHFIYTTFDVYPKWLKTFNIAPSSQAKQRNIAKQWPRKTLLLKMFLSHLTKVTTTNVSISNTFCSLGILLECLKEKVCEKVCFL